MRSFLLKTLLNLIPSHVRITTKVSYELVYIPEFKDGETLGETRYDIKQIVIKSGESPSVTAKVIIHEIFHAFAFEYDFTLTENQVLSLEKAVYKFLKLNGIIK